MTSLTTRACYNVTSRLAFGSRSVMTGRTASHDARVIHCRTSKRCGGFMAGFTTHTGLNVGWRFAFSACTVMAGCTTRHDASMAEGSRYPSRGTVARIT